MAIKDEDGVDRIPRDSLEDLVTGNAVWLMTILTVHSRPPANKIIEIFHRSGCESRQTLKHSLPPIRGGSPLKATISLIGIEDEDEDFPLVDLV
nr:hypothetical protein [uncultured Sphingomonas sp.]